LPELGHEVAHFVWRHLALNAGSMQPNLSRNGGAVSCLEEAFNATAERHGQIFQIS
jgi:hypothetical protein